ncbi:actin cortical patch SUR7/pH-response regulator pali [Mycena galopus ATCC 62051]|nr:actin cortical patch SUR7/pH-response regulator pali [Mycena galopus ATCC 62051]
MLQFRRSQLSLLPPVFLFVAFLLLLLVTLSAPIAKTIILFRLAGNVSASLEDGESSATGTVVFGVWGYCVSAVDVKALFGIVKSSTPASCSARHLGYTFDSTVANVLGVQDLENDISKTLTAVLALHPVVAVLSFITLLIYFYSLYMLRRGNEPSRLQSMVALGIGIFTAFLTTVVFLIDCIVVATIRNTVHKASHGVLTLSWGNAVWMTLVAALVLWIAIAGWWFEARNRRLATDPEKDALRQQQ